MEANEVLIKVIQILLVASILSMLCGALTVSVVGETGAGLILGILTAIFMFGLYVYLLEKRETKKLLKHIYNLGLEPDHIVNIDTSGIAIDRAARKIFVGNIKKGKPLNFDDITGVELERVPSRDSKRDSAHLITVSTNDYSFPSVTASLRPRDGKATFEKMRIALGMS